VGTQPAAAKALAAAAELDGQHLDAIDAHGKHLLYRFAHREDALHVHLGLFGRFRRFDAVAGPEPRPTDRLLLAGPEHAWRLAGATASELLDPAAEDRLLARLGPDPLRADADPERAWAALRRRRIPLAHALMQQDVIAGVGNMYRAEVLWARELPPHLPARELARADFDGLWAEITAQLCHGVEHPRSRRRRGIYRKRACGRCGGPVRQEELAARTLWWCPNCQR